MKHLNSWQDKAIGAWLAIISIFQLYTATVGIFQPRIQRGIHLLFLLPAAFVLFPTLKKTTTKALASSTGYWRRCRFSPRCISSIFMSGCLNAWNLWMRSCPLKCFWAAS